VRVKPRHGQELATILNLKPATISHHLSILSDVGLLVSEKDQYYQMYSLREDILKMELNEAVKLPQAGVKEAVAEDAYRDKVIKSFFKRGRLVSLPRQLKKWNIVLEKIANEFEPERKYNEKEVNMILLDFNDDVASLRRGMIDQKFMVRDKGIYQRVLREKE